jgi:hypothetical protein
MSVRPKLTMLVDITPLLGQDGSGSPVYGTKVEGVACFAFGSKRRNQQPDMQTKVSDFQFLFNPEAVCTLNSVLTDARSKDGTPVMLRGVVVNIEDNHHYRKGLMLRQASVNKEQ